MRIQFFDPPVYTDTARETHQVTKMPIHTFIPLLIHVGPTFFEETIANQMEVLLHFVATYQNLPLETSSTADILQYNQDLGGVKIKQVRDLTTQLSYQTYKADTIRVVFIWQLESASVAAQNALLKTLEEPPANTLLLLICADTHQVLPTILSRCQLVPYQPTVQTAQSDFEFDLTQINESYSAAIELADHYKDKTAAVQFTRNLISFIHHHPQYPTPQLVHLLKRLLQAQTELNQNINPKLVLESVFFSVKTKS